MLNDAKARFFSFQVIKMRYLKKVLLVICIELYCLIHLNIPNLKWRNFEQTNMIFLNIDISRTISDIEIWDRLLFQSCPCMTRKGKKWERTSNKKFRTIRATPLRSRVYTIQIRKRLRKNIWFYNDLLIFFYFTDEPIKSN